MKKDDWARDETVSMIIIPARNFGKSQSLHVRYIDLCGGKKLVLRKLYMCTLTG